MKEHPLKAVLGPMRPPFLMLVPVCVCLGATCARWNGYPIDYLQLTITFIGALAAHISVNALNEYHDYKTGLDFHTPKTPFSGGSGTLQAMPDKAGVALTTSLISLGITVFVGIYFMFLRGIWILPLGLIGVADIILYTHWLTRFPFLCLIAPGLGFGTLMVMGTFFALTGEYSWTSFAASMTPFFLVSNLLLLNQFPDAAADKSIGRKHIPILWGNPKSAWVLGVFYLCAYSSVGVGYVVGVLPMLSLLSFITIAISIPTTLGAYRFADNVQRLIPYMAANVIITLLTPLLLSLGLVIASA
jgi:1,4-dihydroxy-2-naphthoate polyprenyltransferase